MHSTARTVLTDQDEIYCKNILKEVKKEEALKTLQLYIKNNPELNAKTDTYNLLRFLRACKFDTEKAIKKLHCFYTLRGTADEWYSHRDPFLPEIQELLNIGVFLPVLKRDPEGAAVVLIRIAAHNPQKNKQNDVFKTGLMILDLFLDQYEDASVYGIKAIFDMNGVSLGHARQLTTSMIKQAVHSWQNYPVRIRALEFFNSPPYINVVLNIFLRFMDEKIRSRVRVHGYDKDSLHAIIPKAILPQEYGGDNGNLKDLTLYWKNAVEKGKSWFIDDELYKYKTK